MSLTTRFNARVRKLGIAGVGGLGVMIALVALSPVSGAWLYDSRDGQNTITTGTLRLADIGDNGTFNLGFDGLVPGASQTDSFNLENTGTIAGTAQFQLAPLAVQGTQTPDMQYLHYTVSNDKGVSVDLGDSGGAVDLGALASGESESVSIKVALDPSAGNDWQGITATNAIAVTLVQS